MMPPFDANEAVKALAYEIGMLTKLPCLYNQLQGNNVNQNALLEAFLIHARLLHDFFFKGPVKDDIAPQEIIPNWRVPTGVTRLPQDEIGRMNKMLAHFTRGRLQMMEKGQAQWNLPALRRHLLAVAYEFCASDARVQVLVESELSSRFELSLAQIKHMITPTPPTQAATGAPTSWPQQPVDMSATASTYWPKQQGKQP